MAEKVLFPPEFISRVKKGFPEAEVLHRLLDAGDIYANRVLGDIADQVIKAADVVVIEMQTGEIDRKRAKVLVERAKKILLAKSLHRECGQLWSKYND